MLMDSEDGGQRWQIVPEPTPHDLHAVGIGRRRAVAVGAQGGIWISSDAGKTWSSPGSQIQTPIFDTLSAISFSPSQRIGFAVGDNGRILRGLDGGESWTILETGAEDEPSVAGIDTPAQGRHSLIR